MTRTHVSRAGVAALAAILAAVVPASADWWTDHERQKLKGVDAVTFHVSTEHMNFDSSCDLGKDAYDNITREIEYFSAQQLRRHFVTVQDHMKRVEELYADPSAKLGSDASGHLVIPPDYDKKIEAAHHYNAMPWMGIHVTTFGSAPGMCAATIKIEIEATTTESGQVKIDYNGVETSRPRVSLWGPHEMVIRASEQRLWGAITEGLTKQLKDLVVDWTAAQ